MLFWLDPFNVYLPYYYYTKVHMSDIIKYHIHFISSTSTPVSQVLRLWQFIFRFIQGVDSDWFFIFIWRRWSCESIKCCLVQIKSRKRDGWRSSTSTDHVTGIRFSYNPAVNLIRPWPWGLSLAYWKSQFRQLKTFQPVLYPLSELQQTK